MAEEPEEVLPQQGAAIGRVEDGARMQMIVVMKLTEPRIVPKPEKARPMIHMSAPTPGDRTASESGE